MWPEGVCRQDTALAPVCYENHCFQKHAAVKIQSNNNLGWPIKTRHPVRQGGKTRDLSLGSFCTRGSHNFCLKTILLVNIFVASDLSDGPPTGVMSSPTVYSVSDYHKQKWRTCLYKEWRREIQTTDVLVEAHYKLMLICAQLTTCDWITEDTLQCQV